MRTRLSSAFTLIELMVAIMLLGMIITFLLSTLGGLKQSSQMMRDKSSKKEELVNAIVLLQKDIIASDELQILASDHYSSIEMRSTNSIYEIDHPYIRWFVDPKEKRLIRSESAKPYIPPYDAGKLYEIHLDEIVLECDWMKEYISNNKNALLIGMQCMKKTFFIELATPQYQTLEGKVKDGS